MKIGLVRVRVRVRAELGPTVRVMTVKGLRYYSGEHTKVFGAAIRLSFSNPNLNLNPNAFFLLEATSTLAIGHHIITNPNRSSNSNPNPNLRVGAGARITFPYP